MTQQPEALRLADEMERLIKWSDSEHWESLEEAAAELRRLHALNEDLYQQGVGFIARINELEAALRQALEALEDYVEEYGPHEKDSGAAYAITAAKQALEKK